MKKMTIDQALWTRLFNFIRATGFCSREEAEDVTQEVFCKLLAGGKMEQLLQSAENDRHLFAFLRTTARRYLITRYHHDRAEKRQGWADRISLDDENCHIEPEAPSATGGRDYLELEELVAAGEQQLGEEFERRGGRAVFESIRETLVPEDASPVDYAAMSRSTGKSESTLRVTVYRARQRYREIVAQWLVLAA